MTTYLYDDGLARVYAVYGTTFDERAVSNEPVPDWREPEPFFAPMPDKLLAGTVEITEHEANLLTGYYLPGSEALERAADLLERVAPDDPQYGVARAQLAIVAQALPELGLV